MKGNLRQNIIKSDIIKADLITKLTNDTSNNDIILGLENRLFWYFYKFYNDYSNNDLIDINFFKIEQEFKIKIIEDLRNKKSELKKFRYTRNKLEDDILNSKRIELKTFISLCNIYSLSIIILKSNNTYTYTNNIDFNDYNIDKIKVIKYCDDSCEKFKDNKMYEINLDVNEIDNIIKNNYYLENIDKPLKAISAYKLCDILEIIDKINNDFTYIKIEKLNNKKKTKLELYNDLFKFFS